jgi:hypothetical protein
MAAKANKAYTDFPGTVGLKTSAKAPSLDAKFVEMISAPATPEERILECEYYENHCVVACGDESLETYPSRVEATL